MKKEKNPLERGAEKIGFIKHSAEDVVRLIDKANGTPSKFLVRDLLSAITALRQDIEAIMDEQLFK